MCEVYLIHTFWPHDTTERALTCVVTWWDNFNTIFIPLFKWSNPSYCVSRTATWRLQLKHYNHASTMDTSGVFIVKYFVQRFKNILFHFVLPYQIPNWKTVISCVVLTFYTNISTLVLQVKSQVLNLRLYNVRLRTQVPWVKKAQMLCLHVIV